MSIGAISENYVGHSIIPHLPIHRVDFPGNTTQHGENVIVHHPAGRNPQVGGYTLAQHNSAVREQLCPHYFRSYRLSSDPDIVQFTMNNTSKASWKNSRKVTNFWLAALKKQLKRKIFVDIHKKSVCRTLTQRDKIGVQRLEVTSLLLEIKHNP
ncbi:hypothetical protein J6590_012744 [Homalodisca vitripennis]|nr:hypothetical protein J6590_012744 [Homalodisca vitripennis]